jgi:hypothetical protein
MARTISLAAICAAVLGLSLASALAQPVSTPADRVLRPGDTIQWTPAGPHKLRLGGAGLTPITDVDKVLTFSPPPASEADGTREWDKLQVVTATVKGNADTQSVAQFIFTCGAHPVQMKSRSFTFESKPPGQNPRTFAIRSDPALKWIMQKPDGSGEVQVAP